MFVLDLLDRHVYTRVYLSKDESPDKRFEKLEKLQVSPSCLPPFLGGTYSPLRFGEWLRERQMLERMRYQSFTPGSKCVTGASVPIFLEKLVNESSIDQSNWQTIQEQLRVDLRVRVSELLEEQERLGATALLPFAEAHATGDDATNDVNQAPDLIQQDYPSPNAIPRNILPFPSQSSTTTSSVSAPLVQDANYLAQAKQFEDTTTHSLPSITIQDTEAIRWTARSAVEEALSFIPEADKSAYLKVRHHAPHLIDSESDVLYFVRRENFHAHDAACRLVRYWKVREELFGERAFLPMIQIGTGALTQDDCVVLRCGALALLPKDA